MLRERKKANLLGFLVVLAFFNQAGAGDLDGISQTDQELGTNITGFRDYLMKGLSPFPTPDPSKQSHGTRGFSASSRVKRTFTAKQYNEAAKSDWAKATIMQGLSLLSQQLANTAGTAFAPQSAGQLQQYAGQLSQSDDPQFQQIGSLYSQQAQALQTGDIQGVDQAAAQVSAVPAPQVSAGYQPTSQESALIQAFNGVLASVVAGLGGVLGATVVSQILQALGITNLSQLLGVGQSTGSAIASGQNAGTALGSAGAGAVQTGGAAVLQQLGTLNVAPRQPQNSANAGGAPPAQ